MPAPALHLAANALMQSGHHDASDLPVVSSTESPHGHLHQSLLANREGLLQMLQERLACILSPPFIFRLFLGHFVLWVMRFAFGELWVAHFGIHL
jgi:hypothetical protein